ncbi:TetR/AcrR family transcriptional regulator [Secundilactobacillus folii]|uniref:TetR family transcriptional regulator n=1 Tax=Secundilactobacillus folii TaxID=2678357 RepID=A0A7X2XX28_9LACO|nr:TetR/AcrR family transcriptional regulator [Secundilactobacillus folii]MTV83254.1 TetR family transcriptional regulator [Secundilactobacillus folii]
MATQQTDEKIIKAFSKLVLKLGYQGTTTKRIASEAGVNESTIFRHFKDKHSILEQLVNTYSRDIEQIGQSFEFTGDIVQDLMRVATIYHDFVANHQVVFLLGLRESYRFPEIGQALRQLPKRFKNLVVTNFNEMVEAGEIRATANVTEEATNFILLNFGNAVFTYAYPTARLQVPMKAFLAENIRTFAEHLQ